MPHIVFAGHRIAISTQQVVELKDRLREAAEQASALDLDLVGEDGQAVWLLWTPGAPIVISDADVPPLPEFPMPDFSALGLPGFPGEPPAAPRRIGF